jgi:hypothetical protein
MLAVIRRFFAGRAAGGGKGDRGEDGEGERRGDAVAAEA